MKMLLCAMSIALLLTGCGPYRLQGRVIQGDYSAIEIVDGDDERLAHRGVPGAQLRLTMDPDRLNRKVVAQGASDGAGEFSLPVDEFGAGFLEYDFGLSARRKGYEVAEGFFRLPSGSRRVLVTIAPGHETPEEEDLDALIEDLKNRRR